MSIYACKFSCLSQSGYRTKGMPMHITAAESFIMEALWRRGPLTADDLIEDPGKPQGWGGATVKTLINRLLKKSALKSERIDGRVRYVAQIERADYVQSESQSLLDRL